MASVEARPGARHHVYLSSNFWDGLWIIQQPVAQEISREECVLYVERFVSLWTIVRYPRLWRRLFRWRRGAVRRGEKLWVLAPLPLFHLGHRFPLLFRLEMKLQRRWILRAARRLDLTGERLLWVDHPQYESAVGRMGESLAIYHVGDEVSAFSSSHAPTMKALEAKLLHKAACVFAAAEQLAIDKRELNANTHTIWNGIDASVFEASDADQSALAAIPSPRIAFVGVIDSWVDVELLEQLTQQLPDTQLVIVGPTAGLPPSLRSRSNVHLLGRRGRDEIPDLLRGCSASIIPFRCSLLTRRLVPLKLFEALAAGIMPIATNFSPDLERLRAAGLVRVAESDADFIEQVRQAVAADAPALRRRLREFGLQQTWRVRWSEMRAVIANMPLRDRARSRPMRPEGTVSV